MNTLRTILLSSLLAAPALAQDGSEYLPLQKGNTWTYKTSFGGEMVLVVDRFEKIKDVECAVIRTQVAGSTNEEWLAIRDGALRCYQSREEGKEMTFGTPVVRLKLPPKDGDTWTTSTHVDVGKVVNGSYRVVMPARVEAGGKQREAVQVIAKMSTPDGDMTIESWLEKGVGMVKQVYTMGDQQMVAELVDAKVGGATAKPAVNPLARKPVSEAGVLPCDRCAKPVPAGSKFCAECGAPAPKPKPLVPDTCAKCQSKLGPNAKFCSECGERVPEPKPAVPDKCGKCGAKAVPGARFCGECGEKIGGLVPDAPRGGPATPGAQLERYASADGKVVLFKPRGWKVAQGDEFGEGTYMVQVQNPAETAGVLMIAMPLHPQQQQIQSSIDFTNLVLGSLGKQFRAFEVDKMTSTPDHARTCVEVRFEDEGKPVRGHFYFFYTPRAATFLGLGAVAGEFEAQKPTLIEVAANLAYAPEGVRSVEERARQRAGQGVAADLSAGDVALGSPAQMLRQVKEMPPPRVPMQRAMASDGSFTVLVPQGWTLTGGNGQFSVISDPRRREAVFSSHYTVYSPDRSGLGLDQAVAASGGIVAPFLPPAQALAMLMERQQVGSGLRVLSGNSYDELDPQTAQQIRQVGRQNGSQIDAQVLLAEFTLASTGERCLGIFAVTAMYPSLGTVWTIQVSGGWGPRDQFTAKLPLYHAISQSYGMDNNWAVAKSNQQQRDLAQSQANLRKSISELGQQYERNNAAWHENQKSLDYTSWMRSQTTLGQGTWVAEREGGEVVTTQSWGARDQRGYEAEGQPWNTTNFRGESPWTGEQLREVDTRQLYEKYVRGQ